MPLTDEERRWVEGSLKVAKHLRRERKAGLADAKKAEFTIRNGRLYCERCTIDPVKEYGTEAAIACIEVHHAKVQVADMDEGHETSLDDLECLCANCHRLIHRQMALAKKAALAGQSGQSM
jgi:5-methylcytosine-specific restriction protein A